jgi:hypothetical protein
LRRIILIDSTCRRFREGNAALFVDFAERDDVHHDDDPG